MNVSLRFGPDDRGPDGKLLTLDQLLADSKQAISTAAPHDAPISAPADKKPAIKREYVVLAISLLLTIGVVAYLLGSGAPVAAPVASAPAAPPVAQPTSAPLPTPTAPTVAMLPAYRAPDVTLGPIEATRAITPTAHYGQDWIQADVAGSGLIWLRASDWPRLTIVGPDLAPRPTPVYVAPPPTDPPPPPPCARAGVEGKMVEVCDYDTLESLQARAKDQWIATYGGNVGIVSTPSPQIVRQP